MKMLTKFESKSSRAKCVAFHPKRPWILVSLHSSTIQLWDYRMGTLIDRFEEHDGPVRSVAFHPTQPIFVSGGDDYTIKIWSLTTRKCMYTLNGHLDYVRSVCFHNELPWILSCSDDQTIRVWNFINRQEICVITGHNHYVMSAQFHPNQDLIVSASLDQTVRVWDISGLRKKHSAPSGGALSMSMSMTSSINIPGAPRSFDDPFVIRGMNSGVPQQDIFGNTDVVVKYVLEGHDRGVNWASFHPTLPLIVSGGDDRLVKLWRMSETKAWEVDTCRGHTNNVTCTLFHPTQDLIISVGEDKTVRTWDLNKRTLVKQFKREKDRFWLISSHPNINLFATAHDSGVMVFKLERERPAHSISQNQLYFINKDKQVQLYDYNRNECSSPLLSLKKIGKPWSVFRTLSYNPAERSILVTTGFEDNNSLYALVSLPSSSVLSDPSEIRQGSGSFAVFIARNRFVVYNKENSSLEVKDLNNATTKAIKFDDNGIIDVVYGGAGSVLILKKNAVILYNVQQKKQIADISVNNVKYVSWSLDGQYLALLSKHTITIVDKKLQLIISMHETIRIKSAAWDDTGVLLYSTLNHIKYTLLNGDNGIIKTLDNTVYITKIHGSSCYVLTRAGTVEVIKIDPTEYRFKKALVNKNFNEVLRIIKKSNLVGQNIIAYLQKKGYPEIALQFVEDSETRFELAIECGNLDIAYEEAKKLDSKTSWETLGHEALQQGNIKIVEFVYQKLTLMDKLSFFYLITGDSDKLAKMEAISQRRQNISSFIQNSIYLNSSEKRAKVFLQQGNYALAFAIATSNGLEDLSQEILQVQAAEEGEEVISPDQIFLPNEIGQASILTPIKDGTQSWPLKQSTTSLLEKAIMGQMEGLSLDEHVDNSPATKDASQFNDEQIYDEEIYGDEVAVEDDAWGDDNLEVSDVGEDIDDVEDSQAPGITEVAQWIRNSRCAAGHVAAGSFDTAAQLLNRQLGIVNFEPLRKRFLEVYQCSKLYLPANEGLPSINAFIRKEGSDEKPLPFIFGFDDLDKKVQEGYRLFKVNNLKDAIEIFREIIYTIVVLGVSDKEEETKCVDILHLCREYILGLSIELARRSLAPSPENVKRNLELAAYFTKVKLHPSHRVNALQVAMTQSFKNKNFSSASYFAGEFLKIVRSGARAETAKKIKNKADQIGKDSIEIDFDPYTEFDICAKSFVPIYKGSRFVTEALVGAKYQTSEEGKLCSITKISQIGAPASGLNLIIA
ncbi:coatomer subunit alpha [Ascoidea rubescens DSM 1968]|uniref:Coatomer subunit alpha n=1 Tax=Ascoidea rubescens DSM 1968 TaxID=1344418 RepID=A0A1D2VAU0_9ASCO|nr:Coatomer, alpha subunit [Ascoidea rubescens DSM 1968]ODV58772.1 Coatomer, alpha subunit [Ascoidea rubescens DSM 1968]